MMKKIFFRAIPLLIAIILLCGSVAAVSVLQKKDDITASVNSETDNLTVSQVSNKRKDNTQVKAEEEEMLAVWVPYMSIDMSGTDRSESAYRKKIDGIMKNIHDIGANTVIFQVRPFCDALYKSKLFPTSHIISGKQGEEINYDPLQTAIEIAHKYKLSLHAWINPLRIKSKEVPNPLADSNPYMIWKNDDIKENDNYTFSSGDGIYLNPAYPEVRKLIIDGAREIAENYDIDGLQIDDYFYPENGGNFDKAEYDAYTKESGKVHLSLEEWRQENINMLVTGLYSAVHEKNGCVFGISPQCNTDNNIKMGADVFKWCSYFGYADYICPQLYISESHPTLPYKTAAEKWKKMTTEKNIKLYFGLALYKIGTDADNGTWLLKDDNIVSQMKLGREIGADGFMLYSYDSLLDENAAKEVAAIAGQ